MKEYNIAIYIRLSIADEDTGTSKAESDSVGNQRSLINRFLDRHPALSKYPRSEFCDDGFTGTNTDRPAFTDMMNRVKKGEFNLICVKDFSRFSRDYIEIGDSLECLFPFLGVRFISVNDNYDSDNYIGTTGGLDVVMRNIVYAAYSKDLSMKTTTAKIQLMKQGKFVGGYAPYGYVLHPTIRNKLAIDPEAAEVVRKIFLLAIDGNTPTEIAIRLNDEGIPTPGQYFIERHPDTKKYRRSSDKLNWSHAMIYRTLAKLVYTGCAVGHERRTVAPLSRKTVKQDIEKQFIVENMHEAIVSREEYDQAQAVIRKTGRSPAKASYYPLRSLVRCGNCGRCMTFLKSKKGFHCTYGRTDRNSACPTEAIHTAADIEQRIYNAIMLFLKSAGEKGNLSEKLLKKKKSEIQKTMDMLTDFQKQCGKLKKQKLKSYEEYSGGAITKQAYLDEKRIIDEKLRTIEDSIDAAKQRIADLESMEESEPHTSQLDRFLNEPSLTYEMAHAFVEAVYIYPDGTTEICWKFKDFTESNQTGINQT